MYQHRGSSLSSMMTRTYQLGSSARDETRAAAAVDVSVGVDIVEVDRFARLMAQPGLENVLTERELRYCRSRRRPAEHIAARFAAKEAILKAFGTGIGQGIRWTDVEILKEQGGRPIVALHGAAEALASRRGLRRIDVSLSHTAHLAIAQAAALWEDVPGSPAL
jgi:holo-[acyl-carrier protein] synthase